MKLSGLSIPHGDSRPGAHKVGRGWSSGTEGGEGAGRRRRQPAGGADGHAQIHPAAVYINLAGLFQASNLTSSK